MLFRSDFHLGVPNYESSLEREKRIVRWLSEAKKDAKEIYLLGDVFDFWFEYKHAVPKGFVRLQGKIAEITDSGIPVYWFTGNHDMWIFDYIPKELGVKIYRKPIVKEYNGKRFYIGHGDGLGPGDKRYKFIKKVFASTVCQWLFARLHPNFGIWLGKYFSGRSRITTEGKEAKYLGDDKEWLAIHCKDILQKEHIDYFVFGHRHLPIDVELDGGSRYINLGDWVNNSSYAVFEGNELKLKYFES